MNADKTVGSPLILNDHLLNEKNRVGFLLDKGLPALVLLSIAMLLTAIGAQAAVCYADPQHAYNDLLAQENSAIQDREQAVVNINQATEAQLTSLDGIGSTKAQEIMLYREMFGEFKSVDELAKVKGIGKKTIENNRARLQVNN